MRSACHSQDAYLSFYLFLTIPLDLWLPLWLSVSISLPLYVSGSTALSASSSHSPPPSVCITAFEHKYAQVPPQLYAISLPCLQWLVDQPCSSRRCALPPSLPDWVTVLRSHMCSSDLCESLPLQKVSLLRLPLTCIGRVMIYYISSEFWITSLIPWVTTLHWRCQGKIKPGFRSWEGLRHNCCVVYVRILQNCSLLTFTWLRALENVQLFYGQCLELNTGLLFCSTCSQLFFLLLTPFFIICLSDRLHKNADVMERAGQPNILHLVDELRRRQKYTLSLK